MRNERPTLKQRIQLHHEHPDVPCAYCARCYNVGELSCLCIDDDHNYMLIPYNAEHNSCMFVWDLASAAMEAHSRLEYMRCNYETSPIIKDIYDILHGALLFETKEI